MTVFNSVEDGYERKYEVVFLAVTLGSVAIRSEMLQSSSVYNQIRSIQIAFVRQKKVSEGLHHRTQYNVYRYTLHVNIEQLILIFIENFHSVCY